MLFCIIAAEVLTIFIDGDTRIEGMQIGDHEIKIVNFADNTTIFWRDFSCLTKIELILELSQKSSRSKINFSKIQTLWGVVYKNRIDQPKQMTQLQFSIKMVEI